MGLYRNRNFFESFSSDCAYQIGHSLRWRCGRCANCSSLKSSEWSFRIMSHSVGRGVLPFTLTYTDDMLSSRTCVDNCLRGFYRLDYSDFQRFFKRFKVNLKRVYHIDDKVTFFAKGEYGSKFGRPHFHVLFFFDDYDGFLLHRDDIISCLLLSWHNGLFLSYGELMPSADSSYNIGKHIKVNPIVEVEEWDDASLSDRRNISKYVSKYMSKTVTSSVNPLYSSYPEMFHSSPYFGLDYFRPQLSRIRSRLLAFSFRFLEEFFDASGDSGDVSSIVSHTLPSPSPLDDDLVSLMDDILVVTSFDGSTLRLPRWLRKYVFNGYYRYDSFSLDEKKFFIPELDYNKYDPLTSYLVPVTVEYVKHYQGDSVSLSVDFYDKSMNRLIESVSVGSYDEEELNNMDLSSRSSWLYRSLRDSSIFKSSVEVFHTKKWASYSYASDEDGYIQDRTLFDVFCKIMERYRILVAQSVYKSVFPNGSSYLSDDSYDVSNLSFRSSRLASAIKKEKNRIRGSAESFMRKTGILFDVDYSSLDSLV